MGRDEPPIKPLVEKKPRVVYSDSTIAELTGLIHYLGIPVTVVARLSGVKYQTLDKWVQGRSDRRTEVAPSKKTAEAVLELIKACM